MLNHNKKNKQKRGHWYWFDCAIVSEKSSEGYCFHYFDVRLFVSSAREGIYTVQKDFPNAMVLEIRRLDKIDAKDFPYIFKR